MKKNRRKILSGSRKILFAILAVFFSLSASAQQFTASGQVLDAQKEPLIGVSVQEKGTTNGAITDLDGNFTLTVRSNATLIFSYVGYKSQEQKASRQMKVTLQEDNEVLEEVVVIGYGSVKRKDVTTAISTVSTKDLDVRPIVSAGQAIQGKAAGISVIQPSGTPGGEMSIRVRGTTSMNGSNDPLYVVDGVPVDNIKFLSPNDIESMQILKDASSTAIYGSRASNGVILITTKKGSSDKMKITFSTTNSIQTRTKLADMLSYDQFVNTIRTQGTAAQQALLGTARTDWNDEIYQNAFGTDNNLSITGKIAPNWPIRVSVGYYNQSGLLRTDNAERYTGSVTLNPSFFKDHLKLNINAKGSINNNTFGNTEAIWAASTINPTIPVYSDLDTFGGYTEAVDNTGAPVNGAVMNPVGLIQMNDSHSNVRRFIGNIDADYRVHFFPDLKLHATIGYDYAQGKGSVYVPAEAAQNYTTSGLITAMVRKRKKTVC